MTWQCLLFWQKCPVDTTQDALDIAAQALACAEYHTGCAQFWLVGAMLVLGVTFLAGVVAACTD